MLPTKILSGWDKFFLWKAVQKDRQAVMRNPTKLLIHNGLQDGKRKKKKSIYVTKETFYRQWEETVVGLKTHIHRKRVQVDRKHYL